MGTTEFAAAHRTRRPGLWRGQVAAFGIGEWSLARVRARFGADPCDVSPWGRPVTATFPSTYERFVADFYGAGFYTASRVRLQPGQPPAMLADLRFPNPFLEDLAQVEGYTFLAGREGTGTLPHRHGDALNLLVEGRKRWVLFDAARGTPGRRLQEEHRERYPPGSPVRAADWFDREHGGLREIAESRGVEVWECVQESGDVVYVPRDFSHAPSTSPRATGSSSRSGHRLTRPRSPTTVSIAPTRSTGALMPNPDQGRQRRMPRTLATLWGLALAVPLSACGADDGRTGAEAPGGEAAGGEASTATEAAPPAQPSSTFRVRFETTEGDFTLAVYPEWAPRGAERFRELVEEGYYDGVRFYRAIDGFMVQFGLHGDPERNAAWMGRGIPDDPVHASNTRGRVTFATAGPDTRATELFINLVDNARLDGLGFSPIGEVVEGMDVVDRLHTGYGELWPSGSGPDWSRIVQEGNAYLAEAFPEMDWIQGARIVEGGS